MTFKVGEAVDDFFGGGGGEVGGNVTAFGRGETEVGEGGEGGEEIVGVEEGYCRWGCECNESEGEEGGEEGFDDGVVGGCAEEGEEVVEDVIEDLEEGFEGVDDP